MVAPTPGKSCKSGTFPGKSADQSDSPRAQKNCEKTSVSRGDGKRARQDSNLQPLVPKNAWGEACFRRFPLGFSASYAAHPLFANLLIQFHLHSNICGIRRAP